LAGRVPSSSAAPVDPYGSPGTAIALTGPLAAIIGS
jgi:hypothetical protein